MSNLIITDVAIRQDSQNRYCLNDLYKAAGSQSKHQPSKWLITQQSIELVEYLKANESITRIPVIFSKQGVGTFVIKPLVYAYAMWISPIFHLHVIEAYDSLVTNQTFDFLKPISEPLSIADFEWRYQVISNALNNLKNAQVIIKLSGAEFLAGK
jgi:hypothetical protein